MEPTEADLEVIGSSLRRALANEGSESDDVNRARESVLEEFARHNQRPGALRLWRRGRRVLWPAALLTSLATAAAGLYFFFRPLSFQLGEAHSGHVGDPIESFRGYSTPLHFSDGSQLVLHEGGRMRVLSLGSRSARLLVEKGVLDVSVAHTKTRRMHWSFEAGPFLVTVTGTKFQMAYDSHDQSLRLATQEGQVVVSGGCQPGAKSVSAGEHIELSCPNIAASARGDADSADKPAPPPSASDGEPQAELPPEDGRLAAPRAVPAWRALLAAGRLSDGLHAAERDDFQRACKIATARELMALADAARLFGPRDHAVVALRMLQQRFPGTTDAATAAYRLGLIAFEEDKAYAPAARWFGIYLRSQPAGPLMGDAFGRMMQAQSRAGDNARARETAQEYLRRFPKGPYAREASGIASRVSP